MDVKWVAKWKKIKSKQDPNATVLIIRIKMTASVQI